MDSSKTKTNKGITETISKNNKKEKGSTFTRNCKVIKRNTPKYLYSPRDKNRTRKFLEDNLPSQNSVQNLPFGGLLINDIEVNILVGSGTKISMVSRLLVNKSGNKFKNGLCR